MGDLLAQLVNSVGESRCEHKIQPYTLQTQLDCKGLKAEDITGVFARKESKHRNVASDKKTQSKKKIYIYFEEVV